MCATPKKGSAWCSQRHWNAIGPSMIWPGERAAAAVALGREGGQQLRRRRRSRRSRRRARAGTAPASAAFPASRGPSRTRRRSRPRRCSKRLPVLGGVRAAGRTSRGATRGAELDHVVGAPYSPQCRRQLPSGATPVGFCESRLPALRCYARRRGRRHPRSSSGTSDRPQAIANQDRPPAPERQAHPEHRELRREPVVRDHHQRGAVVVGEPRRGAGLEPRRRLSTSRSTSRSCGA